MTITYTVWLDRNRDGLQTSDEDITAHVISLKWRLGMARPYDTMAPPGWAEIMLDARSGAYTGTNASALMGRCLTILSDDGTTRTHFVGFISSITPTTGEYGTRLVRLHAHTRDAALSSHTPAIVPTPLAEAKALIRHALVGAGMPYRVTADHAILNDAAALVGTAKIFADVESYSADAGLTTLAYGGAWGDRASPRADAFIQEVIASERGRFFCDREGTLRLLNRHTLLQPQATTATLVNDMVDLTVSGGEHVINDIEIRVMPRRVGAANTLLWTLDRPVTVAAGEIRRLHVPLHDDETQMVGALLALRYTVTAIDQLGSDVAALVSGWLSESTLTGTVLSLRHTHTSTITITGAMVYGTPLYCEPPQTARIVDMPSVMQYGRRHQWLNLSALSTLEQAEDIARYEVGRRKTLSAHAAAVTMTTQSHPVEVLGCTLYDAVSITETQSLPATSYVICAEEHQVEAGGSSHRVTWLLEPIDGDIFACVDQMLDEVRVIAY